MASGGSLSDAFRRFATKGEKTEATTKDMAKCFKDAGLFNKNCTSTNLDIAFSKVKTKGKTTITFKQFGELLKETSKAYAKDKKIEPADAEVEMTQKILSADPKYQGTKTSKTGGVDKMTDTSKYTGSHKERFDESGKGKGLEGRETKVDNTGYVGNYKGEGTFPKK